MYEDKILICRDCGAEFVFSGREQEFYAEKGFQNEPGRCPECRAARKQQNGGGRSGGGERRMYEAVCSGCGAVARVPFEPRDDRPVYCSECFSQQRRY